MDQPAGGANLVQQRVLPQSEHHHVGAIPGAKRGEKVLKNPKKKPKQKKTTKEIFKR